MLAFTRKREGSRLVTEGGEGGSPFISLNVPTHTMLVRSSSKHNYSLSRKKNKTELGTRL